ncbi:MAG: DUF3267 domain-containing protein [Anaerolineae bacterium]|nr:DUF3267 domain-containing protein [Anaerolineae bacterium]
MALFGAAMLALSAWYLSIGAPLALPFLDRRLLPPGFDLPALIALLVLLVLPLHELCHGLAFRLLGVGRVRYGIKLSRLVLYAAPAGEAYFRRDAFIAATLAPLAAITLLGAAGLLLSPPGLHLFWALAVALNAGGAVGDMAAVALVRRYPPSTLVRDFGTAFAVYRIEQA